MGKPGQNKSAEFDDDILMVTVASTLLLVGPVLPLFICVLPRQHYIWCEVVFDAMENAVVIYATCEFGFTNSSLVLTVMNFLSTAIDVLLLNGPEALDGLLKMACLEEVLQRCIPSLAEPRAGIQLSFAGRHVPQQKFSIVSFPGVEAQTWKDITESDSELSDPMKRLAVACVFFPDGDSLHGKHSTPCMCQALYGALEPQGCLWFVEWRHNVRRALQASQTPVVVYKRGKVNSQDGLGRSQRGEVKWLEEQPEVCTKQIDILHVDVDKLVKHVVVRARQLQGVDDLA